MKSYYYFFITLYVFTAKKKSLYLAPRKKKSFWKKLGAMPGKEFYKMGRTIMIHSSGELFLFLRYN